jgi:hypothetical protein
MFDSNFLSKHSARRNIPECMKIATYNVNGIKSRLPNLLAWLERERPDIACLQELKAPDAGFPTLAGAGAGYKSVAKGQRSSFSGALVMYGSQFPKFFPKLDADSQPALRLLWIACGTKDFLRGANQAYKDWLGARNVRCTAVETPGGHAWTVWRRTLTEFAPLLFQKKTEYGAHALAPILFSHPPTRFGPNCLGHTEVVPQRHGLAEIRHVAGRDARRRCAV